MGEVGVPSEQCDGLGRRVESPVEESEEAQTEEYNGLGRRVEGPVEESEEAQIEHDGRGSQAEGNVEEAREGAEPATYVTVENTEGMQEVPGSSGVNCFL